jgi:hypothetical protein
MDALLPRDFADKSDSLTTGADLRAAQTTSDPNSRGAATSWAIAALGDHRLNNTSAPRQ